MADGGMLAGRGDDLAIRPGDNPDLDERLASMAGYRAEFPVVLANHYRWR